MNSIRNEQRAAKRSDCGAPVVIENCATGVLYDGSMYNYSREGMYIELDYPLRPGSKIRISGEKAKHFSRAESCQAKVIWCEEIQGAVVLYSYGLGILIDRKVKFSNILRKFEVIDGGAAKKNK